MIRTSVSATTVIIIRRKLHNCTNRDSSINGIPDGLHQIHREVSIQISAQWLACIPPSAALSKPFTTVAVHQMRWQLPLPQDFTTHQRIHRLTSYLRVVIGRIRMQFIRNNLSSNSNYTLIHLIWDQHNRHLTPLTIRGKHISILIIITIMLGNSFFKFSQYSETSGLLI